MPHEITRYTDLEKLGLGIIPLTGEACNLGYRILFDLTKAGKELFIETYGLHPETRFADSWNSGTNSHPHVASVMIPYDAWHPLAVFGLLKLKCIVVLYYKDRFIGITEADSLERSHDCLPINDEERKQDAAIGLQMYMEDYKRIYGPWIRTFRINNNLPGSGTRCQHQMSGRIN